MGSIPQILAGGLGVGEESLDHLWVGGCHIVVLVDVFGQIEKLELLFPLGLDRKSVV